MILPTFQVTPLIRKSSTKVNTIRSPFLLWLDVVNSTGSSTIMTIEDCAEETNMTKKNEFPTMSIKNELDGHEQKAKCGMMSRWSCFSSWSIFFGGFCVWISSWV